MEKLISNLNDQINYLRGLSVSELANWTQRVLLEGLGHPIPLYGQEPLNKVRQLWENSDIILQQSFSNAVVRLSKNLGAYEHSPTYVIYISKLIGEFCVTEAVYPLLLLLKNEFGLDIYPPGIDRGKGDDLFLFLLRTASTTPITIQEFNGQKKHEADIQKEIILRDTISKILFKTKKPIFRAFAVNILASYGALIDNNLFIEFLNDCREGRLPDDEFSNFCENFHETVKRIYPVVFPSLKNIEKNYFNYTLLELNCSDIYYNNTNYATLYAEEIQAPEFDDRVDVDDIEEILKNKLVGSEWLKENIVIECFSYLNTFEELKVPSPLSLILQMEGKEDFSIPSNQEIDFYNELVKGMGIILGKSDLANLRNLDPVVGIFNVSKKIIEIRNKANMVGYDVRI